jgi:twitching motility protein PilT
VAKIDLYLNSLVRFGATAAVLSSGGNVTLKFPAGDRFASQTTSHADLVAMIDEVCPKNLLPVKNQPKLKFGYGFNGKTFTVRLEVLGPTQWRVSLAMGEPGPMTIAPTGVGGGGIGAPSVSSTGSVAASSGAAAEPPGPPSLAGVSAEELAIERTSYESVGPAAKSRASGHAAAAPAGPSRRHGSESDVAPAAKPAAPEPIGPSLATGGEATAIERLLIRMKELGASDLHLSSGMAPIIRLHGEMQPIPGTSVMSPEVLLKQLYEITPPKNRKEFEERNDTDFAHSIPNVSRFRANMFRDRSGPGAVFRAIPFKILTPDQLGLPPAVLDLCYLTKGLVVVTGPTGSGKSTTLSALVDFVNRNRSDHIITIEDPIEFVHENKKCLVNQREVHTHTRSFKDALRAALREDPDIVLVGEMRDLETIAIAVETAETGHLVFGTLHTTTAPSTIDRIIDQFPSDRQEQIRQMLSESLKGVIAQTLCKKIGGGRVAAYEILIGSSAVSNLIREAKTFQLFSLMQTGRNQGMCTLNDSLLDLVRKKLIEPREAYMKSVNKAELKNSLSRDGISVEP